MTLPKTVSSEIGSAFGDSFSRTPILQQGLPAARIALVEGLHLADAVGTEMPKALAELAPRHDDPHAIEKAQRERPDGAPGAASIAVEIADPQFALGPDRLANDRQFGITGGDRFPGPIRRPDVSRPSF